MNMILPSSRLVIAAALWAGLFPARQVRVDDGKIDLDPKRFPESPYGFMTRVNTDGDDKDVWPWLGETPRQAKANSAGDVRFNLVKLEERRGLFEYVQTKGGVTEIAVWLKRSSTQP
jgi:hypothetical protein